MNTPRTDAVAADHAALHALARQLETELAVCRESLAHYYYYGITHATAAHLRDLETPLDTTHAPTADSEYAKQLLTRWHEWARAHGHDTGILDDTRQFLFGKSP